MDATSQEPDPQPAPWWAAQPARPGPGDPRPRSGPALPLAAVAMVVAVVLAGGIGGALGYLAADRGVAAPTDPGLTLAAPPSTIVDRPAGSVALVAATVLPSVVSITVTSGDSGDSGSGIVLTTSGYILTNNHVVAAAASGGTIEVTLQTAPTLNLPARIVGRDPESDLAVIKLNGVTGLRPAVLGNSASLQVGDPVLAIGSPLGLAGTVTTGIVSALNRPVLPDPTTSVQADSVLDAIQTDAPINPGNSGGALVNAAGQVIGVNSAIATLGAATGPAGQSGSIGLGFAIPIDYARSIAQQLIRTGHAVHPLLGVEVDSGSQCPNGGPTLPADRNGALVCKVTPGSPAAQAGLVPGDIIVGFDSEPVTSADTLVAYTRVQAVGSRHTLEFIRAGQLHSVQVSLASQTGGG
jgi:putative serine protease PepD